MTIRPGKNPSFVENRCWGLDILVFLVVDLTWDTILGGGWGIVGGNRESFSADQRSNFRLRRIFG